METGDCGRTIERYWWSEIRNDKDFWEECVLTNEI